MRHRTMVTRTMLATGIAALSALAGSAAQAACDASASAPWADAGDGIRLIARTLGPDCREAVAVIVVRDGTGRLLYQDAFAAKAVFSLEAAADGNDVKAMAGGLQDWIETGRGLSRTGQLPDWPEGDEQPVAGEFPFFPAPDIDAAFYRTWRAADVPMTCFAQGLESARCLAVKDGVLMVLGVQSFPG